MEANIGGHFGPKLASTWSRLEVRQAIGRCRPFNGASLHWLPFVRPQPPVLPPASGRGDALATCGDIESNPGPNTGRPGSKRKQSPQKPPTAAVTPRITRPEVASLEDFPPVTLIPPAALVPLPDADSLDLQAYYEALTALPPEPQEVRDASVAALMNSLQEFLSVDELRLMEGPLVPLLVPLAPPPVEDPMLLDSSMSLPLLLESEDSTLAPPPPPQTSGSALPDPPPPDVPQPRRVMPV